MVTKEMHIGNKTGLHARPAGGFCNIAKSHKCDVKILFNGKEISAKSIFSILGGCIIQGSTIVVQCDGEDEKQTIEELYQYISNLKDQKFMIKKYPMLMLPYYADYLWGGEKLKKYYHKNTDVTPLAESWELSCYKDGNSKIANGDYAGWMLADYIAENRDEILGKAYRDTADFPILVKLIDAAQPLSVQVHPDNQYAIEHENDMGKTEMWYVLEAEPDAQFVFGFSEDVTKEQVELALKDNSLDQLLNRVPARKGDVFFVEPGTVHAIGAGIVVAEIQQSSNTTYRVWDYLRRDKSGNFRELHVDKALDVMHYKKMPAHTYLQSKNKKEILLAKCQYFTVIRKCIEDYEEIFVGDDSFLSALCIDGSCSLSDTNGLTVTVQKGDTVFIPAGTGTICFKGCSEILEII